MRRHLPILLTLLTLATPTLAQDDLRFLSATTFQDPNTATHHAYLLWQAEEIDHLRNLSFELYAKPGAPPSAAPFTRRGRMALQTSVPVIETLLASLPASLIDAPLLEERIDSLFGSLLPDADLTLAMKISGILQVAEIDPDVFRRLLFFSRAHPFLGIAMGTAGTYPLTSPVTTLELRTAIGDDAFVEARVVLDVNNPPVIPPPGPPVHVVDQAASGHLNAKIRWGVPDALARKAGLTYGYNLYRINRAFAEANNFHTTPPTPDAITALIETNPAQAALVNRVPVMPIANLTPAEAADLNADPDTAFITDDRGVILDHATQPFHDGDAFYYFTAARDILGRPGTLSTGTLITICDRQRPEPPSRGRVRHLRDPAATQSEFLRVTWEPAPTGDAPDYYLVYRWENPSQMIAAAQPFHPATNLVSAPIPHSPAATSYTFDDTGPDAPHILTGDDGKTYWYSIRAVKITACGPLHSGNSAPAWGVLRDRLGPLATGASTLVALRSQPEVTLGTMSTRSLAHDESPASFVGNGDTFLRITVTRTDPRIASAALFRYTLGQAPIRLDQKQYAPGDDLLEARVAVPNALFGNDSVRIVAAARDIRGRIDFEELVFATVPNPNTNAVAEIPFTATFDQQTITLSGGGIGDDPVHDTLDPDTGETNPLQITFFTTEDAREYKLYKRIDGGPLLLVRQGPVLDPLEVITIEDTALPANASQVCYFVQYFDEHGNPSPLADLGCVRTTAKAPLPVPILARPEKAGTEENPHVTLRWFSETFGVERFRVHIDDGDTPVPIDVSPALAPIPLTSFKRETTFTPGTPGGGFGGRTSILDSGPDSFGSPAIGFVPWQTGRIGGNFGDPTRPNEFEVTFRVAPGRDHRFYIQSVSPAGDLSDPSNIEPFIWSPSPPAIGPIVPWPARSLPPVDDAFNTALKAQYILNPLEDRHYAAIKIGEVPTPNPDVGSGIQSSIHALESGNPVRTNAAYATDSFTLRLYTSRGAESALPFVLYRTQLPSDLFPTVSGDIVQVSPLLDRIRTHDTLQAGIPFTEIVDPFLDILRDPEDDTYGLYFKDTQGVARGATYQYILTRFTPDGEIDRSIPLPPLTIPLTDP